MVFGEGAFFGKGSVVSVLEEVGGEGYGGGGAALVEGEDFEALEGGGLGKFGDGVDPGYDVGGVVPVGRVCGSDDVVREVEGVGGVTGAHELEGG